MADNIFKKPTSHNKFTWEHLGNIEEGRGDLGTEMPVLVYRLMQYTMLDVLSRAYGEDIANEHFREAGWLAGTHLARETLDMKVDLDTFLSNLQEKLRELKIGVLRMEDFDPDSGVIELTVGQDLDCSGLPVTNEVVCMYDEGFIAGILEQYTKKKYQVREVDCWANGNRVCRFRGAPESGDQ